jgi:hypothetical protein
MNACQIRRSVLIDAAEAAYRRARAEVFDRLPVGMPIAADLLTPSQRDALDDLASAEAELEEYRKACLLAELAEPATTQRSA